MRRHRGPIRYPIELAILNRQLQSFPAGIQDVG